MFFDSVVLLQQLPDFFDRSKQQLKQRGGKGQTEGVILRLRVRTETGLGERLSPGRTKRQFYARLSPAPLPAQGQEMHYWKEPCPISIEVSIVLSRISAWLRWVLIPVQNLDRHRTTENDCTARFARSRTALKTGSAWFGTRSISPLLLHCKRLTMDLVFTNCLQNNIPQSVDQAHGAWSSEPRLPTPSFAARQPMQV
jgi:hypothetical protein